MRIAIAQLNPLVGDVHGNTDAILRALDTARADRANLLVATEMCLTGYPPKDLLDRGWFIDRVQGALERLRAASAEHPQTALLIGAPLRTGEARGKGLYNAAILFEAGAVAGVQAKSLLPTYDVFDEARYFDRASAVRPIPFRGRRLGVHVCEDAWCDPALWGGRHPYDLDPVAVLAAQGADIMINLSASPFHVGKERLRMGLIRDHALTHGVPFIMANQVGGNDDLVFDGRSMAVDAQGRPTAVLAPFEQEVRTIQADAAGDEGAFAPQEEIASVHAALVMGLRDYATKCGFRRAVIGLSGGIDSAVTCCLAAAALRAENVLTVAMPSPYSSEHSIADARQLAENLGVTLYVVPIHVMFDAYLSALKGPFQGAPPDVTEENIQARIRGNILMALSNKFGHLVLSTGNKSELAVGYCTLYGDMSGGLAVLSDVPKTMVYALAHYINREREIIPRSSVTKPPSAELRPNQTDQDSLPPYPLLDEILRYYVEEALSAEQIIARGLPEDTVRWVIRTVDRNEYKRGQAAPGLRVTTKAFGAGWRMPIAAKVTP